MSLARIVAALGGDLYDQGRRANVPAPGHSAHDRSISLLLSEGRVVVHGFGGVDWKVVLADLRGRGLVDEAGRPAGTGPGGPRPAQPDRLVRVRTAARLWEGGVAIGPGTEAARHLLRRSIPAALKPANLRRHPAAPVSVYRPGGPRRPALIARISDPDDRLTGVEITYLEPGGGLARTLRLPRKTVGLAPPGSAVRLASASVEMLVGEGVITTLSAMSRFALPGWALMAARNLAAWTPPPEARRVLIAADRGRVGEAAALQLKARLERARVRAAVLWPDPPHGDWNEVEADRASREGEEGRMGTPERRG